MSSSPPTSTQTPPGNGGNYYPFPPPFPFRFHLLEVTVISGQDLHPATRSMQTYAIAWVHPAHKLRTRLDPVGHTEPTWNDKFVFRVDDSTLRSDTAAVTVDVYASRSRLLPGHDTHLGTARSVLSTLRPTIATRFVALQVRRPASLRPQGILNIGVTLLDAYVRSLPLYADLGASSAFAYKDLVIAATAKGNHGLDRRNGAGKVKEVTMVKSRSAKLLDAKLEKWKEELPPHEEEGDEKSEKERRKGGLRPGRSKRSAGRMSCFSLAGASNEGGGGGGGDPL